MVKSAKKGLLKFDQVLGICLRIGENDKHLRRRRVIGRRVVLISGAGLLRENAKTRVPGRRLAHQYASVIHLLHARASGAEYVLSAE